MNGGYERNLVAAFFVIKQSYGRRKCSNGKTLPRDQRSGGVYGLNDCVERRGLEEVSAHGGAYV